MTKADIHPEHEQEPFNPELLEEEKELRKAVNYLSANLHNLDKQPVLTDTGFLALKDVLAAVSKSMIPMTDDEYVAHHAQQCPYCRMPLTNGSHQYPNISPNDVDDMLAYRSVICTDCGKRWDQVYKVIGWEGV